VTALHLSLLIVMPGLDRLDPGIQSLDRRIKSGDDKLFWVFE
jgi:hypothetical protein